MYNLGYSDPSLVLISVLSTSQFSGKGWERVSESGNEVDRYSVTLIWGKCTIRLTLKYMLKISSSVYIIEAFAVPW